MFLDCAKRRKIWIQTVKIVKLISLSIARNHVSTLFYALAYRQMIQEDIADYLVGG